MGWTERRLNGVFAMLGQSRKLLLSFAVLGVSGSIAGLGAHSSFTSSTSASSHSIASGTVTIALGSTGSVTNRLNINASGLVPGDTVQRTVTLSNSGSQDLASITLTIAATTSTALDTDTTDGLVAKVERCSQQWTEAGTSPAFTYTCGGTTSTVLAERDIIGSSLALSNLTTTTAGNSDYLRFTITLPSSAGNSLQGLTSVFTYTFTGTQRTATNK